MHKPSKRTKGGRKTERAKCDVCQKSDAVGAVALGGEELAACKRCMEAPWSAARAAGETTVREGVERIAEGYGARMKGARERAGLTQRQLAAKISEKERYVEKLEREMLSPSIATARKIERVLGVRLVEREK